MKKYLIVWMLSVFFFLPATLSQAALDSQFNQTMDQINRDARNRDGEQKIVQQLRDQFHVDQKRIDALKAQNLNFGDISVALSLANQMPGGINDDNLQKIVQLRQGATNRGWDTIASSLNVDFNRTQTQMRTTSENINSVNNQDTTVTNSALDPRRTDINTSTTTNSALDPRRTDSQLITNDNSLSTTNGATTNGISTLGNAGSSGMTNNGAFTTGNGTAQNLNSTTTSSSSDGMNNSSSTSANGSFTGVTTGSTTNSGK